MTQALSVLRALGAALILCGGILTRHTLLEEGRRIQRTRRALAASFEGMEAEIRSMLTPAPKLLLRPCADEAETFFRQTRESLSRGEPFAAAWREASASLKLPETEREAVASLGARLDSGEESACAALRLTAAELRNAYAQAERTRVEQERLTTSICVSISLFLTILLL